MAYFYYDREGKSIEQGRWVELSKDDSYRILREYDNGSVFLRLMWRGRLTKQEKSSFRDTWPLFQIIVGNYDSTGNLVRDPVMDGMTYPDEQQAMGAYEAFLETWTESHRAADGKFLEVDNALAPPPPPDPDIPTSTIKGTDFVAW